MTQTTELPTGRGLRPIDASRLRTERLAEAYSGLPAETTKRDLLKFVGSSTCVALGISRSAKRMLMKLLQICHESNFKTRSELTGEYGETFSLIVTASNATLGRELDIGENRVRCALQALSKAGWISFRDSTTRKRFAIRSGGLLIDAYGIDLRPACARVDELRETSTVCKLDFEQQLRMRREISQIRNRLAVLAAWPSLRGHLPEILDAIRLADRARKWSSSEALGLALMQLLDLRVEFHNKGLEAAQALEKDVVSRGAPLDLEGHITASQKPESSDLYRSFELGGGTGLEDGLDLLLEPEGADGAPEPDREPRAPVRAPGVEQLLKTMPTILEAADVAFVAPRIFPDPRGLIDTYVSQAAARIGIEKGRIEHYKDVLGDQGYRVAVLLAAYKPDVEKPAAYVAALVTRASIAGLSNKADPWMLDLNKTWFGLYRKLKGQVVH